MKYLLLIALIASTFALRADDQCKKDIVTLHQEVQKMVADVKAQNQNATEVILMAILREIPVLNEHCHLEG
jgi:hypothetical protein